MIVLQYLLYEDIEKLILINCVFKLSSQNIIDYDLSEDFYFSLLIALINLYTD